MQIGAYRLFGFQLISRINYNIKLVFSFRNGHEQHCLKNVLLLNWFTTLESEQFMGIIFFLRIIIIDFELRRAHTEICFRYW